MERERLSVMTFDLKRDELFGGMSAEKIFRWVSENGVPYLDVMNLSDREVEKYCGLMEKYPVKIKCYIGSCSMLQDSTQIYNKVSQHLDTAKKLRAGILMLVPVDPAKDVGKAKKMGHDRVLEKMIEGFRIAVRTAEGSKIQIGLETTPQDYSCCSGCEDCKSILEAVPGLGLIYDTANMLPHGDTSILYYESLKKYIIHVHLKDITIEKRNWINKIWGREVLPDGSFMNGVLPGTGIIPIEDIRKRLEKDGYEGGYAIEYRRPKKVIANLKDHTKQLQKVLGYLEKE